MPNEQEIREMAKLTMLSGKLNEVQLKNLQAFPLVFFNGVTSATVEYDLDIGQPEVNYEIYKNKKKEHDIKYSLTKNKPNTFVSYRLVLDGNAQNEHLEKRFASLEKAVRDLFWKEVKVRVFFHNFKVYESENVK